jgi:AsmA protein
MGRIFKVIAMLVAAVIGLVLIALVAVGFLVDANDYKDEIAQAVRESTGRELTLEGDLDLKLFPWVSVAVGQASLGNAPGFGDEPFAQINNARLSVKLLPLFSQRIEVGDIELDGLVLRMARDRQGRDNWSDLVADEPSSEAADIEESSPEADEGPAASLNVSGINVTNAALYFNDAQQDNSVELENLNFRARGVSAKEHFPLSLQFDFKGPDIVASVDASVDARLDIEANSYDVRDADVKVIGRGDSIPGGEMDVTVAFAALAADLNNATFNIDKVVLVFDDLRASGDLQGENLAEGLVLKGPIKVEPFSPQSVLKRFNVDLQTADEKVMQNSSAEAVMNFSPAGIMFSEVDLILDDTHLRGNAGRVSEQIRFDLTADAIDVDRYLPPTAEDAAETEGGGSLDEVDLPLDAIRQVNIRGKFTLQQAKFSGLSFSDLVLDVNAGNGELRLVPSASAYGGSYSGNIAIKARANDAVLSLEQNLNNVDLNPLGADLYQVDKVSGVANAAFKLSASGSNLGEILRKLNGTVDLNLADGAWEGIDLWHEFRKTRALFKQEAAPEAPAGPPRTPFSAVTATAIVTDGVARNDDLRAVLPFMVLTGQGNVNLPEEAIDFDLVAEVLNKPELASDPTVADLGGTRIPLKLSGPISDPKIRPDFAGLIQEEAKRKIQDALFDQLGLGDKDEAAGDGEPAGEGEPAEEESPEDMLKKKLKGLFR